MAGDDTDGELLQRAISGDRTALSCLLLEHYDDLLRQVTQRLATEVVEAVSPEDILQQVFVRAAVAIHRFEAQGTYSFRAWLATIAGNLVRDVHKRRRRERRTSRPACLGSSDASSPNGHAGGYFDQLAADSTSPSMRVHRHDNVERLQQALASLPPEQREVIQRYYLRHESLDQIAASMQRTKDTVRGICFRARQTLRRQLGHSSGYFAG